MTPPGFMFGVCHPSCSSYIAYYIPILPCWTAETGDEGDKAEQDMLVEEDLKDEIILR
jgi:hypothetical protein